MDRNADLGDELRDRRAEIEHRLQEIRRREEELLAGDLPGATAKTAALALAAARAGLAHAIRAYERTGERHEAAALVHERVATTLEEHGRHDHARAEKEAANENRQAAAVCRETARAESEILS